MVGEGFTDFARSRQPLTPGFALGLARTFSPRVADLKVGATSIYPWVIEGIMTANVAGRLT